MTWILVSLWATTLITNTVSTELSNSACFGAVATNATTLYLACGDGAFIDIVNVTVGAKASTSGCPASFTDADSHNITCCSPSPGVDCEFELMSKTDYTIACNGKASCEPEAGNADASGHCTADFNPYSLYMYIQYRCVSESDETIRSSNDSQGFPGWGIAVIVVSLCVLAAIVASLVYYKVRAPV